MKNNYLNLVKPLYSTHLDHFHNYEHAKLVTSNAKKIAEKIGAY